MPHVITFTSSRFDVADEPPNPITPIAGHSVLTWLRGELNRAGWRTTDPATEDWGWYIDAEGTSGASEVGWTIQIHKTRSLRTSCPAGTRCLPTTRSRR